MTLKEIATQMKTEAAANLTTPVRRKLKGGLRLILVITLRQHRLSLVREDIPPSTNEIRIIKRDFGIPPTGTLEYDQKLAQGQSFYIARLIWPRSVQLKMIQDQGDKVIATIK